MNQEPIKLDDVVRLWYMIQDTKKLVDRTNGCTLKDKVRVHFPETDPNKDAKFGVSLEGVEVRSELMNRLACELLSELCDNARDMGLALDPELNGFTTREKQ